MSKDIRKIQTQGVHHITLMGADRQTSIDFWEGVLGMPFIFDQPNLDDPEPKCIVLQLFGYLYHLVKRHGADLANPSPSGCTKCG